MSEKALQDLKKNYFKNSHPIFHSGVNNIYTYYDGKLTKAQIEDFLSSVFSYTRTKEVKKSITNPTYKPSFKRYQFQVLNSQKIFGINLQL